MPPIMAAVMGSMYSVCPIVHFLSMTIRLIP
jgi:hypothetical protein